MEKFSAVKFSRLIIRRRKYFACLIFVVEGDREKTFTAKISQSMVMQVYTHTHTQTHTCTAPPSAPRNVEILLTTNTSVSLRWDPPEDLGERNDFFYTLIAIEESTMVTKSTTTIEGNITTGVLQSTCTMLGCDKNY